MDDLNPESHSQSVTPIPIMVGLAFWLVVYSVKVLPQVIRITPDYFEEDARDFQLPMGPTLSKGTLEEVHLVVLFYIPSIIRFFFSLGALIFYISKPWDRLSLLGSALKRNSGLAWVPPSVGPCQGFQAR